MSTIIQALTFTLANPIDATQVTIPVRNLKDSRGTAITSLPIGALLFATIEPRSPSNQEIISFTGITNNGNGIVTLTGVIRNLNPQSPYTTLGGLVPHGNNAEVILSNNPPFYNNFLQSDSVVVITGSYQFPEPTLPAHAATKNYVDTNFAKLAGGNTLAGTQTFNGAAIFNGSVSFAAAIAFSVSPTIPDATLANQPVSLSQLLAASLAGAQPDFDLTDIVYGDYGLPRMIRDKVAGVTYILKYDSNRNLVSVFGGGKMYRVQRADGRYLTSIIR